MTIEQLRQTFANKEWPSFEYVSRSNGSFTVGLFLDPGIRWFVGHFPEQPLLAGVVQTHWAGEIGRVLFGIDGEFSRIDNLKFQSVLLPGQSVSLQLTYLSDSGWLKFRFEQDERCFSQGKLVFVNPGHDTR